MSSRAEVSPVGLTCGIAIRMATKADDHNSSAVASAAATRGFSWVIATSYPRADWLVQASPSLRMSTRPV